jgi:hypothetical protein
MTAPASWLVYDAWQDFFYSADDGVLRLRAGQPGRYPLVHPLFWAMAEVAEDGTVTLTVRRVFRDGLTVCALAAPAGQDIIQEEIKLPATFYQPGYHLSTLPDATPLNVGTVLRWRIDQ